MRRAVVIFAMPAVVATCLVAGAAPVLASSGPASVTIETLRSSAGDTWSATGAITDAGTFVDPTEFFGGSSSTFHATRVFSGGKGTFTAVADVRIVSSSDPDIGFYVVGRWVVTGGSGAYATLRGGGSISEEYVIASDSLVGTWTGTVVVT
jgi:hypothetical protein